VIGDFQEPYGAGDLFMQSSMSIFESLENTADGNRIAVAAVYDGAQTFNWISPGR